MTNCSVDPMDIINIIIIITAVDNDTSNIISVWNIWEVLPVKIKIKINLLDRKIFVLR